MNYKHLFHAGSFADVLKHITIIALLSSLSKKATPFCYIDTHAASGRYDLFSEAAQKNKEHDNGITKLLAADNPPALVRKYLRAVKQLNENEDKVRYYPGSPLIAAQQLRANDRAILSELHPKEFEALKTLFAKNKAVATHHIDGYVGLHAFIPPKEKRGLVLIDPPYEKLSEFDDIVINISKALAKWPSGIYAIWFPIKEKKLSDQFLKQLKKKIEQPIFTIELSIYDDIPQHLNGCGITIINPPWKFDQIIKSILPWIWNTLTINNQGSHRAFFMK